VFGGLVTAVEQPVEARDFGGVFRAGNAQFEWELFCQFSSSCKK